ncbi:MAG: hypothetical protein ACYC49_09325 [Ignavibacteriaceae bacterium]
MNNPQSAPQAEAIKQAHSGFKLILLDLKFIEENFKNSIDKNDDVLIEKIDRAADSIYKCVKHIEKKYGGIQ